MSVPLPAILTQAHNLPKEMNNLWLPSISLGFLDLVELVQALSPLNLPRAMHALKIIPGNSDREAANDPDPP